MEGIKKFFSLKNGWMGINSTMAEGKVERMLSNSLFCAFFVSFSDTPFIKSLIPDWENFSKKLWALQPARFREWVER